MSADFDRFENRYETAMERSIGFCWQEHGFFLEAKAARLLDVARRRLGEPGGLRALDVGCGPGLVHRHLRTFRALVGVDVSESMIEEGRRRNPSVEYRLGDGVRLPVDDDSFDVAFAMCVLHHVPVPERARFAADLQRVTRPGGLVVVLEHNPLNPLTRLAVARCEFDEDASLLGRRETHSRLRAAGLRPVEQRYILVFPWRSTVLGRAERALAPVPLGAQYYVAAHA